MRHAAGNVSFSCEEPLFQSLQGSLENEIADPHPQVTGLAVGVVQIELTDEESDFLPPEPMLLRVVGNAENLRGQEIGKIVFFLRADDCLAQLYKNIHFPLLFSSHQYRMFR
jgi:hypothetical protein